MFQPVAALKIRECRTAPRLVPTLGFTLIEILVVIGIISLLAALLFPVFMSARANARRSVCLSNMHQIGGAIMLYAQDYDELYPYGADPSDQHSDPNIWPPQYQPTVMAMPQLNDVLASYVKCPTVWRCPGDIGFDHMDTWGESYVNLYARPTMFDAFGMSYLYRTQIALLHKTVSDLTGYDPIPSCAEHGASEVNVLMDGNGSWHGLGQDMPDKRYNVLMGDDHVVSQNAGQFYQSWRLSLTNPCS
ncbi:MAG TPA: type II secretion system protein [Capsulimonadaceae bacterium]|nr:type II secretion system protein [Capsulimonadaceae bacterium]